MLRNTLLSIVAFFSINAAGCAHTSPEQALEAAQTGLAVVDVASAKVAEDYVDAVQYIRRECRGDEACEKRYKVDDESVAKVTAGFKALSEAYDQAAKTTKDVQEAWVAIEPLVTDVMEAKRAVAQ